MNKTILLLLITGMSFIPKGCFAQENSTQETDKDKKISGIDYSYYRKGRDGRANSEEEQAPQANVVKMGLTKWLSGVIPFYYERRLTRFLSLQFGLGLTTRDFVADGINAIRYDLIGVGDGTSYNNLANYGIAGRKSSIGVYVSFQPKFYLTRHRALTGFFISPMVEFKRFDYKAQYANLIGNNSDGNPTFQNAYMWEYRNCVDFTVNLGRQWFTHTGVSIELMGGVGFQKIWEFRRLITGDSNYGGPYTNGTTLSSYYRPEFNLDLNIGGFF